MRNFLYSALALCVLSFSACQKDEPDDPIIPNEEEVITTLRYTLTPDGGGANVVLLFEDMDGDGGDAPVITVDKLSSNTTYSGKLELWNEAESPAENITAEVEAEGEAHQFFYSSTVGELNVAYNDEDVNGRPIGILTTVSTGSPGSGELTITLRHEPDKDAAQVAEGDISNAGGETDIEVSFEVEVE